MITHSGLGVDNTLYDADNKCIFRNPDGIAGLQRWVSLYQDDKVSPEASVSATFNDAANAFNAGQTILQISETVLGPISLESRSHRRDRVGNSYTMVSMAIVLVLALKTKRPPGNSSSLC
jgi:ABC-type glycerol-3-phosphate transport system substrate-binding protein